MKRVIGLALVGVLFLASPVLAGGVRGSGFSGVQGGMQGAGFQQKGGFQQRGGFQHKGGFQHRGNFHRCCWGSPFLGWPIGTTVLAAPYYDYPYASPVYADPGYMPAPAYQPQPQVYLTPPVQSELCYIGGCYRLQGDGVSVAFRWVWIPAVPEGPPAPPTAPPAAAPAPGALAPTQLYRWVDDQGVANWTNNREAVPERYRAQLTRKL